MALNDGLLTSHESKYHYNLWRPITAIQWAEGVFYPDPNAWKTEHPTTPPYPAYASNASAVGGACATVLTDVFGPNVLFQVNWPSQGVRTYDNYWAAANEQANARIYGGIHFRFDCVAGLQIGAAQNETLIIFKSQKAMEQFVNSGWEFGGGGTAQAGVAGNQAGAGGGENIIADASYYTLTKNGLEAGGALAGTKFWKDKELN